MTAPKFLLMDIGNSRIKFNCWQKGNTTLEIDTIYLDYSKPALPQTLVTQIKALGALNGAFISNVAGPQYGEILRQSLLSEFGLKCRFVEHVDVAQFIRTHYTNPERLGIDRWLVMLGAMMRGFSQSVCVVNCGTATTIDFMQPDGEHLGGCILPGLTLMASALSQAAAEIPLIKDLAAPLAPFATDTQWGISSGAQYATIGAIKGMLQDAEQVIGETCAVLITGGAAAGVAPLATRIANPIYYDNDLIIKGLSKIATL